MRKRLGILTLALLCALLLPVSLPSVAAHVQNASNFGFSSTTIAATFGSDVTAGNLIAVYVSWGNDVTATVADSQSNAYTDAPTGRTQLTSFSGQMFYAKNTAAGATTVTITFSSAASPRWLAIHEISGADVTDPLDKDAMNGQADPGTGTDAVTSGSVTTTTDGQYIFGATADLPNATDTSAGTAFTIRANQNGLASESQIQSSAGAIAATFTSDGANDDFITGIMTFKEAAAAAAVPRRRMIVID